MYPTTRTVVSGRIPEYLENLKAEFESLAHDVNMYKMQRDDYERKLQAQLGEVTNIQQTLFDLERTHSKIKQQYEEEIMRLRQQVQTMQQAGPSAINSNTSFTRSVSPAPPSAPVAARDVRPPQLNTPSTPTDKGLAPLDTKRMYQTPTQQVVAPPPINNQQNSKRQRETGEYYPSMPTGSFPGVSQMSGESPVISAKQHKPEIKEVTHVPAVEIPEQEKPHKQPERMDRRPTTVENGAKDDRVKLAEDGTADWIVGYNPGVQTNLNVDLMHTLDHSSVVCCVKFSNDGKWMATGCNKSAQIYDVETGEKVYLFTEDAAKDGDLYIRSVCFSPDNKFLAAGAEDKTVKLWDIENKRIAHTFVGHELDIYSLDFSKDGKYIVSGSGDKKARIWDVEKGECLYTLGNEEVGPKDGVTSVAFNNDGTLVAAGSLDRIVRLWDARTGYFLERYEGHLDSVYSVAFSPDGKSLASGSLDKTLKLWDLSGSRARSRCRSNFSGHKDFVLSVAFSPDGNWLISGSKDRSVQFWDPKSAVSHMMLQGHKNSVISVAVSPTGGYFATGSGDYRARIWKYE